MQNITYDLSIFVYYNNQEGFIVHLSRLATKGKKDHDINKGDLALFMIWAL